MSDLFGITKFNCFFFFTDFLLQNQIITVFHETNKHHRPQYKTSVTLCLIMFPIDSWNWILFFWPRNEKMYQLMIIPLYGSGVHWILLARVKGQISTSVRCGGGRMAAWQGWFFKELSIASAVIFYSTQLFDAELDLLVIYSSQVCRLGFRCLLLTSSHTYKAPWCSDTYRTDIVVLF